MMKQLRIIAGYFTPLFGALLGGLLVVGCQTQRPVFAQLPGEPATTTTPSATAAPAAPTAVGTNQTAQSAPAFGVADVFHVGDTVSLAFSGASDVLIPPYQETIKDDGTITPPVIGPTVGPIAVAGKSSGDLQKELQEQYNKFYKNLTVTVQPGSRYYYVTGEVKTEGPKPYLGETDIIKAISSAGGFTDFANKKKVQLTRSGAKRPITVNCIKALQDPRADLPVYPGDKIYVPRRWF
jgi:protein involved in polysaccharide export with SLBB domain